MNASARTNVEEQCVTSIPTTDEFLVLRDGLAKADKARAAAIGGKIVWASKHWPKVAGLLAALFGAWTWNDTRIETNILAEQAEINQAMQVKELVVGRAASMKVDEDQNASIKSLESSVGVAIRMSQTTLEVLGEQRDVKAALRRKPKLRKKVDAALEVEAQPPGNL